MPNNSSSVVLDVNAGASEQPSPAPLRAESGDPFRILILGDFSGRSDGPSWKPRRIDRDNFDSVLKQLAPRVKTKRGVNLEFSELADFDPDAIFRRCDLFRAGARPAPSPAARPAAASNIESEAGRILSGSLLDDIVEQAEVPPEKRHRHQDEFQSMVERVVSPHLAPREEGRAAEDRAHSETMRGILHDPAFQNLESAWRALDFLARGLDTEGGLSLEILDVNRAALSRDAATARGNLYRVLVEETVDTPGGEPWALIVGNYVFDRSPEDTGLLASLAALARRAGAPFLAEGAPPDADSSPPEWEKLRASPEARWIGLALPRFLARLPYGKSTYAIDSFPFEEIDGLPEHRDYLWANPAFACALLLGRAFNDNGWRFHPDSNRGIDGLPYYTFENGDESRSQPCAEVLLTDHEIDFLHEEGLMALASMKNRDVVLLMRFQSIARPASALAGRWQ